MSPVESGGRVRVLPSPRPGTPPEPRVPQRERFTLDNGLRVTAVPHRQMPQIALQLVLPVGAAADPAETHGTAALLSSMLTEGTRFHSADVLNARLDGLGASLDVQTGHDFTEVKLFLLSETLEEALPLLAEVVAEPTFPPMELERVRRETLDTLVARSDEPANVADDQAALAVFGAEHPYSRPAIGTEDGVAGVSRESLLAFHREYYRPEGAFLVAAGDFETAALRRLLSETFAGWRGSPSAVPQIPIAGEPRQAGRRVVIEWPDAAQAELRIGGLGLPRPSPDWIPAAVANFILGGSTITGRLGANLREDKGWTYGVRSAFSAGLQAGGWIAETAVDVEVAEAALQEMIGELRRMLDESVSPDELRRAKDALVLSLPRAFETAGRIVGRFSTIEAYGLPQDYWERFPAAVEAVTADDIRRIARGCFDPARLVQVVVG